MDYKIDLRKHKKQGNQQESCWNRLEWVSCKYSNVSKYMQFFKDDGTPFLNFE